LIHTALLEVIAIEDWRLDKPSKQPLAFDERLVPEIAAIKPKQIESIVVLRGPAAIGR